MQSSSIILFFLLALPTANSRFIDSLLQNMDMAKQQMHSKNSDERASSEEVEGSGLMPERHHHSKREVNSSTLDEAANLLMFAMKREAHLIDDSLTVQNLTTAPIRPSIVNGVWNFLDSSH
ncbi:hypothetical protein PRIPAC_88584 [Pristionchus pacificus]|uniref:Uncharacterized protein n=1 Tax=Pristionchus pacificus TaxID=54126 RepID=A0A2A6CZ98_PRIPA|nr:hypothetical protein PRIPAC_88584 [Pristionchus pacificus]|eukprot:PDM83495.1 hypothetical protein PRIPAC_35127 [Pristionchus pacificus]